MKLNGTHQLLVYADDVSILGGRVQTIKEKAEAFLVDSKEIGLAVNADKTKYIVMSRDKNAGRGHNMRIDNTDFKIGEEFKCFGTNLTNQNSINKKLRAD